MIPCLFFLGLVALDILLEVTFPDQVFDLVLQFGALLYGVLNVFMIRTVFVLISVWPVSKQVRVGYKGLIGDGVQDLLSVGC